MLPLCTVLNDCICLTQVVDNSSAFRMTEGVPLVIPEVNPEAMKGMRYGQGGIIANPNCSTIIALMAVTPLHRAAKVILDWSTIVVSLFVTPWHGAAKHR